MAARRGAARAAMAVAPRRNDAAVGGLGGGPLDHRSRVRRRGQLLVSPSGRSGGEGLLPLPALREEAWEKSSLSQGVRRRSEKRAAIVREANSAVRSLKACPRPTNSGRPPLRNRGRSSMCLAFNGRGIAHRALRAPRNPLARFSDQIWHRIGSRRPCEPTTGALSRSPRLVRARLS